MKSNIQKMIGKTWMWGNKQFDIENIKAHTDDLYIITTPNEYLTVSEEELTKDFLPVDSERTPIVNASIIEVVNRESVQMTQLSEILMDNIKKVQNGKEYIDQARSINEAAKSLIDIKKTQIEMLRLLKG